MIEFLEGKITSRNPASVVVDTGGIGYLVHISLNTSSKLGSAEKCRILTHLVVREDAHILFGFGSEEERKLFRHLISVSGVGPSTAMLVLSSLTAQELQQAIVSGDVATLQRIKGIGPKSAQRIIVDLKDKLGKEDYAPVISSGQGNTLRQQALSALSTLGFARNNVEKIVDQVLRSEGNNITVEQLIKTALKSL
jgi:Holliday junction DNA helicase RuvA